MVCVPDYKSGTTGNDIKKIKANYKRYSNREELKERNKYTNEAFRNYYGADVWDGIE